MTGKTAIEWTGTRNPDGTITPGKTWNPVTGCTRVTSGCDHCYAFTLHDMRHNAYERYHGIYPKTGKPMPKQYARSFSEVQLLPERLEDPLHIRTPQRFFVNSMSDLFHSQVPDEYIRHVFEVMRQANWHIFQVLTKRPGRLRSLGPQLDWPSNVWIGVSIENDLLVRRADALRSVPAAVRFLSCEPLLGPLPSLNLEDIHWVITGGESGSDARACDPAWVRDIRDRCVAKGIAFYHKQWGGRTSKGGGRELDGRIWDQYPL
jgi:protein gp37